MLHTNRHLHSGWIHSHDTQSASEVFSRFEARFSVMVLLFAKVLLVLMLLVGLLMITSSRVSGNAKSNPSQPESSLFSALTRPEAFNSGIFT